MNVSSKPQGFEDGKLAKKGFFRCFWGCNKLFSSLHQAGHHNCPSRTLTYADLVEMNLNKNLRPPREYLEELFYPGPEPSGKPQDPTERLCKPTFTLKEIKAGVSKLDKRCFVEKWFKANEEPGSGQFEL